jgi:hypothetical protein
MLQQHCSLSSLGTARDSKAVQIVTCSAPPSNGRQGSECARITRTVLCRQRIHSTKLRSWHDDATLRHTLWSSLGSLYLTSLFLQGFPQIPINLAAIISCYEGNRHTWLSLWFGGKQKVFMKLKILFDYIKWEDVNLVMLFVCFPGVTTHCGCIFTAQ